MKSNLFILFLLFIFSCSTKQEKVKTKVLAKSKNSTDTLGMSSSGSFKEYKDKYGNIESTEERTYFEKASTKQHGDIILKIHLTSTTNKSWELPLYKLNVKAYGLSNDNYDKLIWEINTKDEFPLEIWGVFDNYLKTTTKGCCATEDGYTLYSLETGKKYLSYSGELKYSHLPTWNLVGFQAGFSTIFDTTSERNVIGNINHVLLDPNTKRNERTTFNILSKEYVDDIRYGHSPELEIKTKEQLYEEGLFKIHSFYQNGTLLNKIDTVDYYLTLKFDPKNNILIPFSKQNKLKVSEAFFTDQDLSSDFRIKIKD
jgi:hypothetical protein